MGKFTGGTGRGPMCFVRGGGHSAKPRSRSEIEKFIRERSGEEISKTLSESDKLDILHDGSSDSDRREVSGILATKLPDHEVISALKKMNAPKDKSGAPEAEG